MAGLGEEFFVGSASSIGVLGTSRVFGGVIIWVSRSVSLGEASAEGALIVEESIVGDTVARRILFVLRELAGVWSVLFRETSVGATFPKDEGSILGRDTSRRLLVLLRVLGATRPEPLAESVGATMSKEDAFIWGCIASLRFLFRLRVMGAERSAPGKDASAVCPSVDGGCIEACDATPRSFLAPMLSERLRRPSFAENCERVTEDAVRIGACRPGALPRFLFLLPVSSPAF